MAKRESSKEASPIYYPHGWEKLTVAFVLVMARVGRRDLTRSLFNRDLRSGELGSMKTSDGITMTPLDQSYWQQRTLETPLNPHEGVRVEPYVDGEVYVCRADLDRLYLRAGTPASQADDAQPPKPVQGKPGTKPKGDWPTRVAAWLILKTYEDPNQLENIDALVKGAEDHLRNEIGWAPENTQHIRRKVVELLRLVRR
jgi:hypothetical protein